jgi:LPXTG-site transpeptidase (sortase) family protein
MIAMSLAILATVCLGFVATMSFLGALRAHRDQVTSYDNFRYDLANGTAPVAQTDENGVLLAPGTPVALIDIPALGVHQVVSEGTTSGVLMSGPGHRRDTLLPGQAGVSVIYGRRAAYGGPFRDLGSLKPGDEIVTTTGQAVSKFRVVDVRRAGAPLPPAAQKGRLVLITADGRPWVPNGVIAVDADLQTDAQPANQRVITNATLSNAELPLQGDPAAWVSLLLWTQLLLIVAVAVAFAWARWGRWEAWLLGIPIALAVGIATASQAAQLLPNLM